MKRSVCLLLLLATLTACNTFQGMGKDIEKLGDNISDTAKKTGDAIKGQ